MQGIENHNKNLAEAPCKRIQNYIYKYNDVLGKGNFSTVYKAVNTITNEAVAVKVIELNSLKSTKLKELLTYEIEILQKIDHPNIVKCFQVLTSINNCYIFTELCQGGDLQTMLKKKGQFLQCQLYDLVKDIYEGLSYLAEKNIVHRDLKVSNIFLKNGRAKIADFGFAKQSKQKFDDVSIGSPLYMSPQGFLKNRYGPKTDVWSFGIMLYEVTHGFTPYSHCKTEKQLSLMLSRQLKPSDMKNTLSDDFKDFLLKCLDVNQEKRITFKEMRQESFINKIYERAEARGSKTFTQTTVQDKKSSNVDEKKIIQVQQQKKDLEFKKQPSITQLIKKRQLRQVSPQQTGLDLINKSKPFIPRQTRQDSISKQQYKFVTGNPNYAKAKERKSTEKSNWNSIRISNRVSPAKNDQIRFSKRDEQQKEKDSKKHDSQSNIESTHEKNRQRISTGNDRTTTQQKLMTETLPKLSTTTARNSQMNRYQFATRDPRSRFSESSEDNKYLRFNTSKSINKYPNFDLKYSNNMNVKGLNEQKNQRKNPLINSINTQIGSGTITSSANLTLLSKNENIRNDENLDKNLSLKTAYKLEPQKQIVKQEANINSNNSLFKPYLTEYCTKNKPQQNSQEENRRQSMILNQCFLNNLNLPTEMQFLQAVGLLHYCRLFYKFISLVNDLKQDSNCQVPLRCSERYPLWIMGILGQIMDKIQSKSIIYERSKSSKEGKFKEVVKEYINKYTQYFLKYFPQNSKTRLNNKISSSDIRSRLELDLKRLQQCLQKSNNKNSNYMIGGYYLMKLLHWTRNISLSQKEGKFSQFKGNEIENIINIKKSNITEQLYQSVKTALVQETI